MAERLFTPEEVGRDFLKQSRTKVFEAIASGDLRSIKLGRSRRVTESAIQEFTERKMAEQAEPVRSGR